MERQELEVGGHREGALIVDSQLRSDCNVVGCPLPEIVSVAWGRTAAFPEVSVRAKSGWSVIASQRRSRNRTTHSRFLKPAN